MDKWICGLIEMLGFDNIKLNNVTRPAQHGFDERFTKPFENEYEVILQGRITDSQKNECRAAILNQKNSSYFTAYLSSIPDDIRAMSTTLYDHQRPLDGTVYDEITDAIKTIDGLRKETKTLDEQIDDMLDRIKRFKSKYYTIDMQIGNENKHIVPIPDEHNLEYMRQFHCVSMQGKDDNVLMTFAKDTFTNQLAVIVFDTVNQKHARMPIDYTNDPKKRLNTTTEFAVLSAQSMAENRVQEEHEQHNAEWSKTLTDNITKTVMTNFLLDRRKQHIDAEDKNQIDKFTININHEKTSIAYSRYLDDLVVDVNPCMSDNTKQFKYLLDDAKSDDIAKDIVNAIIAEHRNIRLRQQILEG